MSWLIEAFLDEAREDDEQESRNEARSRDVVTKKIVHGRGNVNMKKLELAQNKSGADLAARKIVQKQNYNGKFPTDPEEYDKFNKKLSHASDAIARHNRRHPEAKLESTNMIVEILQ